MAIVNGVEVGPLRREEDWFGSLPRPTGPRLFNFNREERRVDPLLAEALASTATSALAARR